MSHEVSYTSDLVSAGWEFCCLSEVQCGDDDVFVWWIDRDADVTGALTEIEAAEIERIPGGEVRETRRRARVGVRRVLGKMAGVDPLKVRLERGVAGKPRWVGGQLEFNLSHSAGEIAVAVSRRPIGVDVEAGGRARPWLELARRYFPTREAEWLAGLSSGDLRGAFLEMWVSKEAALKCAGTGLAGYLERAVCRRGDAGRVGGVAVDAREFEVVGFEVAGRGVGAVAWEGGARRVRLFRFAQIAG